MSCASGLFHGDYIIPNAGGLIFPADRSKLPSDVQAGVAQLARALASQAKGRGFESRRPLSHEHHLKSLAENRLFNRPRPAKQVLLLPFPVSCKVQFVNQLEQIDTSYL